MIGLISPVGSFCGRALGAVPALRREVRTHVYAELLNAVCDNDARRARALLAVFPEAVLCTRQGLRAAVDLKCIVLFWWSWCRF